MGIESVFFSKQDTVVPSTQSCTTRVSFVTEISNEVVNWKALVKSLTSSFWSLIVSAKESAKQEMVYLIEGSFGKHLTLSLAYVLNGIDPNSSRFLL